LPGPNNDPAHIGGVKIFLRVPAFRRIAWVRPLGQDKTAPAE